MKLKYRLAIVAVSFLFILGISLIRYRRVPAFIEDFFNAESHPLNLAMFRFIFFIALACSFSVPNVVWFSSLPSQLRFAPPGLEWLSTDLLINQKVAWTASGLMLFFCCTAALGLFTRTSALACLVLGLYVLGVPQFYGKINHNHHLLWLPQSLRSVPAVMFFRWMQYDAHGHGPTA